MIRSTIARLQTTEARQQYVVYYGIRRSRAELEAAHAAWERGDVNPLDPEPAEVEVGVRSTWELPRPLLHVVHHSPSGFEWGYGGSGPSDLALSILCDYFEEDPSEVKQSLMHHWARPTRAATLHHVFLSIVATLGLGPGNSSRWELRGHAIRFWLDRNERALAQQRQYELAVARWEEWQRADAALAELEGAEQGTDE